MSKNLIICKSIHHKNTIKIAQAIGEVIDADIIEPEKVNIEDLDKYEIIGFGSGIYFSKYHNGILNLLNKIENGNSKKVFIFYTSGQGFTDFNRDIQEILRNKNFNVIGKFSCRGKDTYGAFKLIGGLNKNHPNEKDIEKAKEFANSILKG